MHYYALTIDSNEIITGIHTSQEAFTGAFFDAHPELAGQTLKPIPDPSEYVVGLSIRAFDADGRLRFHIDLIKEGLTPCPQGYRLEGNELVEISPDPESPYRGEAERIRDEQKKIEAIAIANSDLLIEMAIQAAMKDLGI